VLCRSIANSLLPYIPLSISRSMTGVCGEVSETEQIIRDFETVEEMEDCCLEQGGNNMTNDTWTDNDHMGSYAGSNQRFRLSLDALSALDILIESSLRVPHDALNTESEPEKEQTKQILSLFNSVTQRLSPKSAFASPSFSSARGGGGGGRGASGVSSDNSIKVLHGLSELLVEKQQHYLSVWRGWSAAAYTTLASVAALSVESQRMSSLSLSLRSSSCSGGSSSNCSIGSSSTGGSSLHASYGPVSFEQRHKESALLYHLINSLRTRDCDFNRSNFVVLRCLLELIQGGSDPVLATSSAKPTVGSQIVDTLRISSEQCRLAVINFPYHFVVDDTTHSMASHGISSSASSSFFDEKRMFAYLQRLHTMNDPMVWKLPVRTPPTPHTIPSRLPYFNHIKSPTPHTIPSRLPYFNHIKPSYSAYYSVSPTIFRSYIGSLQSSSTMLPYEKDIFIIHGTDMILTWY